MENKWERSLVTAYDLAKDSRDPSTQNGAVLVTPTSFNIVARGNNNFPNGVIENDERWERPLKYSFVEHAERNVIYDAARRGIRTQGLVMVCPWAACADCARAIVQAGIIHLVRHDRANAIGTTTNERWGDTVVVGDTILIEGGVRITGIDPIPGFKLKRNGEWRLTEEL